MPDSRVDTGVISIAIASIIETGIPSMSPFGARTHGSAAVLCVSETNSGRSGIASVEGRAPLVVSARGRVYLSSHWVRDYLDSRVGLEWSAAGQHNAFA